MQEVKTKLGKGIDITAERDTFDSWGQRWLKKKAARVSENWYKALEINYKKLGYILTMEVTKLRRVDLEDVLDDLASQYYSERVMQSVRDIAANVMEMCAENRVIEYNPFRSVEIPPARTETSERRALTKEEQRWITDTPHRAQTAAMIMMYAGLRRGELIPLLWTDIDLKEGTITVNKSVEMLDGHPSLKSGGKTENAERVVYIPKVLIEYLKEQKHTGLLVVTDSKGRMMSDSAWRRMWESYIKDLNIKYGDFGNILIDGKPMKRPKSKFQPGGVPIVIPQFTAHWLRHTFITLMYLSGVDVLTAAQQAGHGDIKVTMDIYTHLDKEFKSKNIDKMNKYLRKAN